VSSGSASYAGAPLTTRGGYNLGTLNVIDTEPREMDAPQIATLKDLAANELKAMLYVERKLADEVLPELGDQISNGEFEQSIRHHLEETKQHAANLERAFELLGEEARPDKSHAIDGLVAQHDKVVKNIDSDQVRDVFNAGAAAKTEHLEILGYESMIMTAGSLGEDELVSLLEENLDQEKDALKTVTKISQQLAQQGLTV
jgi:ferritin-like metal-binding protein YciE